MIKPRYIMQSIKEDIQEKMVFIGGARQVGKTTLARQIVKNKASYLNWDNTEHRESIITNQLPLHLNELVFDEIHKLHNWRTYIKGLYDTHKEEIKILVTGSARLDHFKKGGDSLFGRYYYYRLHPFSLRELNRKGTAKDLDMLLNLGGFPEPLLKGSKKTYSRWAAERLRRVIYTDIRDLENVKSLSLLQVLIHDLHDKVASLLSIESLRKSLQVNHGTVARWLLMLEEMYVCYRIPPFQTPRLKALKKDKKLYMWDWGQITDPAKRFENLVACQLLKYCHHIEDTEGDAMSLEFLRDREGREVDFVVTKNKKPLFAVECKLSDSTLSKHIKYFKERTKIPEFYQVHLKTKDYGSAKVQGRCLPFWKFCQVKNMP